MTKQKVKVKVTKKKIKTKNVMLFLLITIALYFAINYTIKLPITNIYITGNNLVSDKEIIALAHLENYPPFIKTYLKNIKKEIKENKYIKDVKVKRKFFGKIYLEIEEYKPLCIYQDKVILSSSFQVENTYKIDYVPYLMNETGDIYNKFIESFSKINEDTLTKISHFEYVPNEVDKERFLLYMVDKNYVYVTLEKIEKINKYNSIIQELEGKKGIIYLDSGDYVEIKGWHSIVLII